MKMLACCRRFWEKVSAADVPVFTIVAWDQLAPATVSKWIDDAKAAGVNKEKIDRAEAHLAAIQIWQMENPGLVKLPD